MEQFTWPDAFAILFAFTGIALIFHGFPDIRIGDNRTYIENNYDDDEED
jgi:hypothetical protein